MQIKNVLGVWARGGGGERGVLKAGGTGMGKDDERKDAPSTTRRRGLASSDFSLSRSSSFTRLQTRAPAGALGWNFIICNSLIV